jgi:hypothetical protein
VNLQDLLEVWYGAGMFVAALAGLVLALLVAQAARRNGEGLRALCLAAVGPLTVLPSAAIWVFSETPPHELEAGAARTAATAAMFFGILGVGGLALAATFYLARQRLPAALLGGVAAVVAVALLVPGALGLAGGFDDEEGVDAGELAESVQEGLAVSAPAEQATVQGAAGEVIREEGADVTFVLEPTGEGGGSVDNGDSGAPVEGPEADSPSLALTAWLEQAGSAYAGDCALANPAVDTFKRCTVVYSVSTDIWVFAAGNTFADYDSWLFVERRGGAWRVFGVAPLTAGQFTSGSLPWPDVTPFNATGVGLSPGDEAIITATGSCFDVRAQPSFAAESLACLADGTAVTVGESQAAEGYVWYEVDGGWIAGPWIVRASP